MTTAITLRLPDQLYEQAQQLAKQQRQELEELLLDEIAGIVAAKTSATTDFLSSPNEAGFTYEQDKRVEQEREAYIAMYPALKKNFFGKHVAIYQGRLVDFDDDYDALYARIDDNYPDLFVWLDTVGEEPMDMINLRSPLFVEN